jgi:hypothetical protein
VYSRAYVRSYADAIGLSGAEVVAEFCECFPEVAFPGTAHTEDRRVWDGAASTPLRLTFAGRPQPWRGARRVLGALGDVLLIGLVSMVVTAGGPDVWMTLALVGLAWRVVSAALPHRSLFECLVETSSRQWMARRRSPKSESQEKEDDLGSVERLPADPLGAIVGTRQ